MEQFEKTLSKSDQKIGRGVCLCVWAIEKVDKQVGRQYQFEEQTIISCRIYPGTDQFDNLEARLENEEEKHLRNVTLCIGCVHMRVSIAKGRDRLGQIVSEIWWTVPRARPRQQAAARVHVRSYRRKVAGGLFTRDSLALEDIEF